MAKQPSCPVDDVLQAAFKDPAKMAEIDEEVGRDLCGYDVNKRGGLLARPAAPVWQ